MSVFHQIQKPKNTINTKHTQQGKSRFWTFFCNLVNRIGSIFSSSVLNLRALLCVEQNLLKPVILKNILQLWNPHSSQIFSEIDEFKICFIPCLVSFCVFLLWLQSRHVYEPQEPMVLATLPTKGVYPNGESCKGAITTEKKLSGLGDSASQQVSGTQCQLGPQTLL